MGDAMAELGIYDSEEDLTSKTFEELYDNMQWQESNMYSLDGDHSFSGPQPGVTCSGNGRAHSCEAYFRRFWPDSVLERIVEETNWFSPQLFLLKAIGHLGVELCRACQDSLAAVAPTSSQVGVIGPVVVHAFFQWCSTFHIFAADMESSFLACMLCNPVFGIHSRPMAGRTGFP
jgi:hypothetical protein